MPHFGTKRCLVVLEDADSYKIEANHLNKRGETFNATQVLRDGLKVYPEEPCLHQALGHQLLKLAEDRHFLTKPEADEIFGCFENAFMLAPDNHSIAIDYARALRKAEIFEEAEEILIVLYNDRDFSDSQNIPVLTQLGKLYEETGQEQWAACCYYGCMHIDPKNKTYPLELNKIEIEFGIESPTDVDWDSFMNYAQNIVDNARSWGATMIIEGLEPPPKLKVRSVRTRDYNPPELDLDIL